MKKSKLILVILISSLYVISINAQTDAGNFLITGSSSFNFHPYTEKYKSNDGDGTRGKASNLTLSPQVGYFVIKGLAAGIRMDLEYESNKDDGAEDRQSKTTFNIGPFVKYYIDLSKIKPFAEGAVALGTYTEKSGSYKNKSNIFAFQLKGGVAYFLNDNIAIEAGLGYRSVSLKDPDDNPSDYKIVRTGLITEIGFTIIL